MNIEDNDFDSGSDEDPDSTSGFISKTTSKSVLGNSFDPRSSTISTSNNSSHSKSPTQSRQNSPPQSVNGLKNSKKATKKTNSPHSFLHHYQSSSLSTFSQVFSDSTRNTITSELPESISGSNSSSVLSKLNPKNNSPSFISNTDISKNIDINQDRPLKKSGSTSRDHSLINQTIPKTKSSSSCTSSSSHLSDFLPTQNSGSKSNNNKTLSKKKKKQYDLTKLSISELKVQLEKYQSQFTKIMERHHNEPGVYDITLASNFRQLGNDLFKIAKCSPESSSSESLVLIEHAITCYQCVMKVDSRNSTQSIAHFNIGLCYLEAKRYQNAFRMFRLASSLNRGFYKAYFKATQALMLLNHFKLAYKVVSAGLIHIDETLQENYKKIHNRTPHDQFSMLHQQYEHDDHSHCESIWKAVVKEYRKDIPPELGRWEAKLLKIKSSIFLKAPCGICKSKNTLVKLTKCCHNFVCDPEYTKKSTLKQPCIWLHTRYSLCGIHHIFEHTGDWRECTECEPSLDFRSKYDWHRTNPFNFFTLNEKIPPLPLQCSKCHSDIDLSVSGFFSFSETKTFCENCSQNKSHTSRFPIYSQLS